ncbi:MAG: biotin-dependent carboxyltransferase family protein [Acidobacteriaceae bacterium]
MSAPEIEILNPGLLTTVQDLGRSGWAHLGISPAGAADPMSARIANRLVGNDEGAAVLEMTLVGATLSFRAACTIALVGADISPAILPMFEPVQVKAGFILDCGPLSNGARTNLAVSGGLKVPEVLGSASTHLAASFGGFHGRALRRGDVIPIGTSKPPRDRGIPTCLRELVRRRNEIRVTRGPQHDIFGAEAWRQFCSSEYLVTERSNRLGLRLSGTAIIPASRTELLTEGVSLGAIQIPPDGQPIILFVDQQTTGGYPKIANVIAADMHCIGQLRPRDTVRFQTVSLEEAVAALREQEVSLAEAFRQ